MGHAEKCIDDIEALLQSPGRDTVTQEMPARHQWHYKNPNQAFQVPSSKSQPPRLAYLDGLRGLAALLVYILHYEGFGRPFKQMAFLESAYGLDGNYYFAALPFIRVLFSGGHLAVAVFFVISGYVLASGPLRSIHAKDTKKFVDSLGSALFRRWLRLYLPVAITTFIWMASWHVFGIKSLHVAERTFADELYKWWVEFKNFSFIYTGNHFNAYNFHVWSIALEFRGSIVVYSMLLAIRRCTASRRLLCEAALVWYFMYVVDGWYCSLFVAGALTCDLDMLAANNALPWAFGRTSRTPRWLPVLLLVIAFYFGGIPSLSPDVTWLRRQPGWYLLSFCKPQAILDVRFYFRSIAAVMVVVAVRRIQWIRRLLEAGFCQYLGKISYGFYLVHGPILWSLGDRLYAASGRIADHHTSTSPTWINYMALPSWGPLGLEVNFLAPHLILFPFTLWMAEVVTRLIDDPSVKFAHFIMRKAFEEGEDERSVVKTIPFLRPSS